MADNITAKGNVGAGTEILATNDIGGVHYSRTKISTGDAGTAADVGPSNPMPIIGTDTTASGNITTQNLVPAGAATAGSAVEIALNGQNQLGVQVTGTYTGALSLQATIDGSTWVTFTGQMLLGTNLGGQATISSAAVGIFNANVAGFLKVRITGLAAMTGMAVVSLRASMAMNNPTLGAGSAVVGTVNLSNNTAAIGDVGVQYRATSTGGATVAKILTAATTNATSVKASAGRLLGYQLTNTTAAVKVMHVHNLAVAPTVGTSVPTFSIVLPANAHIEYKMEGGIAFATGIAYSITGAIADLDATATAVGDVIGVLLYA